MIADRSESIDAIAEFVAAYLNAIRGDELNLDAEDQVRVNAFGRVRDRVASVSVQSQRFGRLPNPAT